jgi:hypothetical protein
MLDQVAYAGRRNLPGKTKFVFEPATLALLTAALDQFDQ